MGKVPQHLFEKFKEVEKNVESIYTGLVGFKIENGKFVGILIDTKYKEEFLKRKAS